MRVCAGALIYCLLCVTGAPSFGAGGFHADQDSAAPQLTPEGLLIRSHNLGGQFAPEERAFLYERLSEAAADLQPVLAKLFAEEVLDLTRRLPASHNRLAMQKNAVVSLSKVDPERAFELFANLDLPYPESDGNVTEDVRAYGARAVFAALWKRKGSDALDQLRAQAQHLGDTGQYPYLATAPIISDLARSSPPSAESLFAEAVKYYSRGSRVRSADEEFAAFLRAVWKVVSRPSANEALRITVGRLLLSAEARNTETWLVQVYSDKGTAKLHRPEDLLLLELLPLVRQMDPDWARRLLETRGELAGASLLGDTAKRSEAVIIRGSGSVAETSTLANRGVQRARLRDIESLAPNDPQAALALSLSLTDAGMRAVAFSRVASALSSSLPARARELLGEARDLTGSLQDKSAKVKASLALAEAAASVGDKKMLQEYMKQAFDLGTEAFQEDLDTHPGKAAIFAAVFNDLSRLTSFGVRVDRDGTLLFVASLKNQQLQAHLWIDAARALYELQNSVHVPPK